MSERGCKGSLSDDDIREAIAELRYVLKNAADRNPADRHLILDLTRTLEDLTEIRINRAKGTDPRLGGAIEKIEEVRTKLGILHRREMKQIYKPKMSVLAERLRF